jgi:DNA primase
MSTRDDQKRQVQQATDIVRLIGEQVALRPKGREFAGLCPFHDDHSPSMSVSPVKQIYKCFSCGAGGDAFAFVMNYHKMTFPEALRHLAERAGITLQGPGSGDRGSGLDEQPSERKRIAAANAQALEFFRALYRHEHHGRIARDYVQERHISPQMVEQFAIGYAPDRWDGLATMIQSRGWDRRGFELAGLISPRKNEESGNRSQESGQDAARGFYDRLRHRLIFPIFDAIGRPIAFGGRKLRAEDEPKYLNSPETALFNKSATLYGLHLAKKPIIDRRVAVIVEGYTDVIACHQAGEANVVATLGTALTMDHVRELRRYADKVVLIFDADAAGQKAADRSVELFLVGDLDVAIAQLPHRPGHEDEKVDPAELMAMEGGLDLWHQAMKQARDAMAYQFDRLTERLDAADTMTARQRIAEQFVEQLGRLGLGQVSVLRGGMIRQRLSQVLHLSESEVARLIQHFAPRRAARPTPAAPLAPSNPTDNLEPAGHLANNRVVDVAHGVSDAMLSALARAERQVIGCLLRQGALFHHTLRDGRTLIDALTPDDLVTVAGRQVYAHLSARLAAGEAPTLGSLLADFADMDWPSPSEVVPMPAVDADDWQMMDEPPEYVELLADVAPPNPVTPSADAPVNGVTAARVSHAVLTQLVTDADAEVEPVGERSEQLTAMLDAAAQALLDHQREAEYRRQRDAVVRRDDQDVTVKAAALDQLLADRRTRSSPTRIARLG